MANSTLLNLALLCASIGLLIVAWRLLARIHIVEDFVLARRRLPAWQTGLGLAINCAPLWLLIGVAMFAYTKGLAAVWMAGAMLVGLALNWWLVAPKLRSMTAATQSVTLSQWFTAATGDTLQIGMRRSIGAIVSISLGLAAITMLQWSAHNLSYLMGVGMATAIVVILVFLLLFLTGPGVWSASFIDAAQAVLTLLALLALASYALFIDIEGGDAWAKLTKGETPDGKWFAGYSGLLSVALVVGVTFGAFAALAQPPAIARYLACRDDESLRRARWIALAWIALALVCALAAGWIARIVQYDAADGPALFARLVSSGATSAPNGIVLAALAAVFAAACASPVVSIATHIASDWRRERDALSLLWCRIALVASAVVIGFAALRMPMGTEERLWLSWHALSASLGPLLLVRLTGKRVRPGSSLGALWAGFVLTILFYLMPDTPGDLLERCLPFIAGMGIALSGGERRQNPDRADRGDKTVHDHLPI